MLGEPLKIGLMCSGTIFEAWQAKAIKELLNIPNIKIALLILNDNASEGIVKKLFKLKLQHLLWTLYYQFVKKIALSNKMVDIGNHLVAVPRMRCKTKRSGKYTESFNDSDISQIKVYDLDVIVRFSFNIISGKILSVSKYGVWSYHHGDNQKYRGFPSCFWEIYYGDRITGAILQKLNEKLDDGQILYKGFFKTELDSYAKSKDLVHMGSSNWIGYVCKEIISSGEISVKVPMKPSNAPIYKRPNNIQMLKYLSGTNKWFDRKVISKRV